MASVLAGGLPLAALSLKTSEGGVIVGPCSPNVLAGGDVFSLPPSISVEGGVDFRNRVYRDLYFLSQTGSGRALFLELGRTGRKVTIKPLPPEEQAAEDAYRALTYFERRQQPKGLGSRAVPNGAIGEPSDSTIYYDPLGPPDSIYTDSDSPDSVFAPQPAQVALFHELVHADHIADGSIVPASERDPYEYFPAYPDYKQPEEESRAVGDGEPGRLAENDLRYELGLPPRYSLTMRPAPPAEEYAEPSDFRPGDDP